jgi:hypothetical protein
MTTVVATGNVGQAVPAGWPLASTVVRAASRADFRQLLAKEEAGALEEGATASVAMKASLAASAASKAPVPSTGSQASPHAAAQVAARRPPADDDPLDPLVRHRAALGPLDPPSPTPSFTPFAFVPAGFGPSAPGIPEAAPRALASLEHLVPALVRRVAWSGDARRGTARLEIGAGELAGATLLVHADDGRVQVHLSVPPGVDTASWQRRIAERLASRNIAAQSVEVA